MKRTELENYAQNVLRPTLSKAKIQSELFTACYLFCAIIYIIGLLDIWVVFPRTISTAIRDAFLICTGVYMYRRRYWKNLRQTAENHIREIMIELSNPLGPVRGPSDFPINVSTSILDEGVSPSFYFKLFKEDPLLEFPNPV